MALEIPETSFPRVIVIGGGFGGIQVAKKLRNKEVQVLVLDQHNYHTFQPLLYQVATGGLEPDSIAFPLRKIFKHHQNIIVRLARVDLIQPEKKTILTSIGEISYDFLVIATGSKTNFFGNQAGYEATNANNSNFLGYTAGYQAINASNSAYTVLPNPQNLTPSDSLPRTTIGA